MGCRGAAAAAALLAVLAGGGVFAAGAQAADPPSIVLIVTDDQRADTLAAMPIVQDELAAHGVKFTNAFVTNPLCCPSRASILTGRYSHGTGVYDNHGRHGGFLSFDDASTVATWLNNAGYRTALIGKYLNLYAGTYFPSYWDEWQVLSGGQRYFDYDLNENGALAHYGSNPEDYSTDVLREKAAAFIRETEGPLFLYFAPLAPHFEGNRPFDVEPAPRHARLFSGLTPWRPPAYDEEDVSDKPAWIRGIPRFSPTHRARGDAYRRAQLQSLVAVDEAVGEIVAALEETGRLENTLVVFTSDNGLSWGEHRWWRKRLPYEESIRVPLIVRYDPLTSPRTDEHMVLNVDLAPTFAELAGAEAPGVEGRSFLGLLGQQAGAWRRSFLLEGSLSRVQMYCGVRGSRFVYTQYSSGEEELYDLLRDPHQLDNLAESPDHRRRLVNRRERTLKLCSPPPPRLSVRSPCLAVGTPKRDVLVGSRDFDYLCGRGGDDRLEGARDGDRLKGGADDDFVYGGSGADRLKGGRGADRLFGESGADRVQASDRRKDRIACGAGRDTAVLDSRDLVLGGCERIVLRGP